jgi:hypothetical protein
MRAERPKGMGLLSMWLVREGVMEGEERKGRGVILLGRHWGGISPVLRMTLRDAKNNSSSPRVADGPFRLQKLYVHLQPALSEQNQTTTYMQFAYTWISNARLQG